MNTQRLTRARIHALEAETKHDINDVMTDKQEEISSNFNASMVESARGR